MSKPQSSSDSSPDGRTAEAGSNGASALSSDSSRRLPPPLCAAATGGSPTESAGVVRSRSAPCILEGRPRKQRSPPAGRRILLPDPHGVVSKEPQRAERGTKDTVKKNLFGSPGHGPAAVTSLSSEEIAMVPVAGPSSVKVASLHRRSSVVRTDANTTLVDAAAQSGSSVVEDAERPVSLLRLKGSRPRQHQLNIRSRKRGGISESNRYGVIQKKKMKGTGVTVSSRRHVLAPANSRRVTKARRLGVKTVKRRTVSTQTSVWMWMSTGHRRRALSTTTSSSTPKSKGSSPTERSKRKTPAKTKLASLKRKSIASERAAKKRRSRYKSDITCPICGKNFGNGASKRHDHKKRRVSKRPSTDADTDRDIDTDLSESAEVSPQPLLAPFVQRRAAVTARERLRKMNSTSSEEDPASRSPEWRPGSGSPLPVCWPRPSVGSRGRSRQRDHQPSPSRRRSKSVGTATQMPTQPDSEEPSTSQGHLLRTISSSAKSCKSQETASESTSEDVDEAVGKKDFRPSSI